MPRPRITLRWLMVAVALAAIALEGWIVWRRYVYYRERAATISRAAATLRTKLATDPVRLARGTHLDFEDGTPPVPATSEPALRMIARMEQLAKRYRRAARYPWLPVAPDPPEPK